MFPDHDSPTIPIGTPTARLLSDNSKQWVGLGRASFRRGAVCVRPAPSDKNHSVSAATTSSTTGPDGVFTAPLLVEYPYKRTVGTLLSRFFLSLQEGRLEGTKGSDGRVYFPPAEFDPVTGEQLHEWVTLPETGTVVTWSWQSEPQPNQPLEHPFAWALITLDGAAVPMLHAVDAGDMARIRTGSRVKVRWAAERSGGVRDIACFDLLEGAS